MIDIVASSHCMQFQGKLKNQTWENDKKPSSGTDFGPFWTNLRAKKVFFHEFYLYYMLDILQAILVCNFKEN